MENREAKTILQAHVIFACEKAGLSKATVKTVEDALDMAISALEKQIPKKPNRIDKNASFDGNWKKVCPACGKLLIERITTPEKSYPRIYNHSPHCICGQTIDWEEES